jgi:hypothetical protein
MQTSALTQQMPAGPRKGRPAGDLEARYSGIVSGEDNHIATGSWSIIGGGSDNFIDTDTNHSFIGGGHQNAINHGNVNSVIGGGNNNIINATPAIASPLGVIGGGQNNLIAPGVLSGAILGGDANNISGSFSAVLGGQNNNDGGFPFTGMYGNGLIATVGTGATGAPSNFWVDELIAANIPVDTTPGGTGIYALLPVGALYTTGPIGSPFLGRPVFVK